MNYKHLFKKTKILMIIFLVTILTTQSTTAYIIIIISFIGIGKKYADYFFTDNYNGSQKNRYFNYFITLIILLLIAFFVIYSNTVSNKFSEDNGSYIARSNDINTVLSTMLYNPFAGIGLGKTGAELSNRVMERFKIKSSGFESEQEAEDALIDYINNKATESGRMFDDKLDELNDVIENKEEGYAHTVESIRKNRAFLLKKVESILKDHYNWKAAKNEDYSDSTMSCYDDNGNLMAVVTLADKCIIVDLAKDITAKVSLLQSDEEIESELTTDVDNAQSVLADRELNQLKDVVANNSEAEPSDPIDAEADYLESLARRVTKLESLYIRRRMRKL